MRNATTDSPWPLSNNPYAKYNEIRRARLQPQTAAVAAGASEHGRADLLPAGGHRGRPSEEFVFVDGGVTMYNNPAFQMFLMATVDRYWPFAPEGQRGWETGADKMLVVSVGSGTSPDARDGLEPREMNLLFNAATIPSALMFAALNEQDLLCRVFGDCRSGDAARP